MPYSDLEYPRTKATKKVSPSLRTHTLAAPRLSETTGQLGLQYAPLRESSSVLSARGGLFRSLQPTRSLSLSRQLPDYSGLTDRWGQAVESLRGQMPDYGGYMVDTTGTAMPQSPTAQFQSSVLKSGNQYMGVPYIYGGNDPSKGIDCSRFTQLTAQGVGMNIPRTCSTQFNWFKERGLLVDQAQAMPGDFVYFGSRASPSGWHVGIYLGNGKILDAAGRGKPVAVRSIAGRDIRGFGRLPGGG